MWRTVEWGVFKPEQVADFVDGYVFEVYQAASVVVASGKAEVASVKDDVRIRDVAGRKMGLDAGYGDDAGFGRGVQIASCFVEVDQVVPIPLRWDAAGCALIDKVHSRRRYVTPDLKAFADQRMGQGRG